MRVVCAACALGGGSRQAGRGGALVALLTCPSLLWLDFSAAHAADKQKEMEEADWLMNTAAAGEASWDSIRGAVADRYAAAGLTEVADFIKAALIN